MVYAIPVIKKWLRALIGWDETQELRSRLDLVDSRLAVIVQRADDQQRRIDLIMHRRETAPQRTIDLDWEAQQVAFLNNPENFKEVN